MADEDTDLWSDDEWRAQMSSADINDLPDSAFAYIEPGGTKDDEGKTVPRDKRHFPVHDAAHVRNALARVADSPFGDKAMPKILAAAKKFGIQVSENKSADPDPEPAPDATGLVTAAKAATDKFRVRRAKKPRHRSGPAVGVEVRRFAAEGLEVRSAADGSDAIEVVGNPIVYNAPYSVRDKYGMFQETMAPGVAANVIANGCDTRFLFNHDGLPLARTLSGTMELADSDQSLGFVARLDARQQLANDLAIAIDRGDVSQMSCGFIVADDDWNDAQDERMVYRFADLLDVSAVTYPASPTTDIALAQQRLYEAPAETRARDRRMWMIAHDLRTGLTVPEESVAFLEEGLKELAQPEDEDRAAPTAADKGITAKIKAAHQAVVDAIHAQMSDPDNGTDPADANVLGSLKKAQNHLTEAGGFQGVDNAPDVIEPEGGPQGDQNAPAPDPSGAMDGTGTRSAAALKLELELMEIRKRRHG